MAVAYFVSDLHLTPSDKAKSRVFEGFLNQLCFAVEQREASAPTHLFLVGDIFDLWIGGHGYFREQFESIVAGVRRLVELGVQVHFFEGNHDLHLEPFWGREIGVTVHSCASYFEIDSRRIRVEHGDLINPDDKGYLFLRSLLRTPVVRAFALGLPAPVVRFIGERASELSRKHTSTAKFLPKDQIRNLIRQHAKRAFSENPFDLIVTGHVHVRDEYSFQVDAAGVHSVNLGSWFDRPCALVVDRNKTEFVDLLD